MLIRPRRNRRSAALRSLVEETQLLPQHLVQPLFLAEAPDSKEEISSLPGQFRLGIHHILQEIQTCRQVGIQSFVLFPAIPPSRKDKTGTYSYDATNFYLQAAQSIKTQHPDICLISDVALDPYSIDGHDGLVQNGRILNDETLTILAKMSVAQAEAGFDMLGPSDMMDGRVGHIRRELDQAGFTETGILSYTAKYASSFYGPFRDALDSAPAADADVPADKKTYQMNPANSREALLEASLDAAEGADMLMVKPALHYLDIIQILQQNTSLPIAAYHVSGECAMLLAACEKGWLEYEKAMPETLLSLRRAGADVILTYFARDYAEWYQKKLG